jgi:luciferase family oxidoreductase group 1
MTDFSLLDLVNIHQDGTLADALARSADLARHAEAEGYKRVWVAEHHGMTGVGAAATSVVIAHLGQATSTIRVGAGGIMLPNHAPLAIAEQFGTLDALFPGRIDLGLGRAPGSDMRVAQALRRGLNSDPDHFPQQVMELQSYFADDGRTGIHATPGAGARPELWILGSSTFGAQLAAIIGLPYAFAAHFSPAQLDEAVELYRRHFRPSPMLEAPRLMIGVNVIAADSDDEAEYLASSHQQAFVAIRSGRPGQLPPPVRNYRETLDPFGSAVLDQVLAASAVGAPDTLAGNLRALIARTGADELILHSPVYDHAARKRSLSIAAEVMRTLTASPASAMPAT